MVNEKRNLIDRDDLIDTLGVSDREIFAKEVIAEAPTVDAVEVVRCMGCEYSGHFDGLLYCENSRGLAGSVSPEGFCSYGERRTDG